MDMNGSVDFGRSLMSNDSNNTRGLDMNSIDIENFDITQYSSIERNIMKIQRKIVFYNVSGEYFCNQFTISSDSISCDLSIKYKPFNYILYKQNKILFDIRRLIESGSRGVVMLYESHPALQESTTYLGIDPLIIL